MPTVMHHTSVTTQIVSAIHKPFIDPPSAFLEYTQKLLCSNCLHGSHTAKQEFCINNYAVILEIRHQEAISRMLDTCCNSGPVSHTSSDLHPWDQANDRAAQKAQLPYLLCYQLKNHPTSVIHIPVVGSIIPFQWQVPLPKSQSSRLAQAFLRRGQIPMRGSCSSAVFFPRFCAGA